MTPTADDTSTSDEQYSAPQPPDYGVNFRDLPEQLKKALIAATVEAQSTEKYIRREEVLQDAQLRFYDVGIQHVYLNRGWNWTMATPGGSYASGNGTSDTFGEYLDDYPISPAYAQIIRAKLSEHDPSIDWQPDDPNEPSDIESAKAGEALRHDFDRNNDIKLLQQQIIYHFQMGGRAVSWTRTEDSPARFGDISGNPPRRSTASIYGSIEAKVPMFASCIEDFPYVILYDDPDIKAAKTEYDWIAKDISAGQMCLEENAYERIARLGVIQSSTGRRYDWNIGDSMSHLISRGHVWLRLCSFESMTDEFEEATEADINEDGNVMTVREKIAQLYPDGPHVVFVGQKYAESWNQSMDDCICVKHAYIGKGQSRMPMMRPMVVVQDRFNQMMNLIAESTDYRVPSTWISCGPTEYAAITKQESKPGAFRNLKELPAGTKVADVVYREDDYAIPASLMQFMEFMQAALPQFMLSAPPSMWGAAQADNRTATGYQLAASQANGIQGAVWDMEVAMFATIYYQNCIAVSRDDKYPEQIVIPNLKGRRSVVDKASLTKGKFRCFPDKESGFPESTASMRQAWERTVMMLAPTPMGMQIFASPDNIAEYVRVSGVKLTVPEAVSRDKQLREIEILLSQPPIIADENALMLLQEGADIPTILKAIEAAIQVQQQQYQAIMQQGQITHAAQTIAAQATGAPAPPMPPAPPPPDPAMIAHSSVPVWPSDYHVYEATKCKDYLSSDQCNTELTIGRPGIDGELRPNIPGVLNIVLHWMEHNAAAALQAPPISGPLPTVGSPPKMPAQPAGS